ncbi:hypothetical protein [Thalassospira sp.]|uniref:hypothetical protein n=1 Tax=Thalassospira sp. TaxID=1912094 RepID=UPI003AA9B3B9
MTGTNVGIEPSTVSADGKLDVMAYNDLSITAGMENSSYSYKSSSVGGGFFGKKKTEILTENHQRLKVGNVRGLLCAAHSLCLSLSGGGKSGRCLFLSLCLRGLGRFALVGGVFGLDRLVMHQRQDGAFVVHEFRAGERVDVVSAGDGDIKQLIGLAAMRRYPDWENKSAPFFAL